MKPPSARWVSATPSATCCCRPGSWRSKVTEIIKLHIGDPNKFDFETPKHVRDALCAAVEKCDNGYEESEGNVELRKAIVEKEKKKNNIDLDVKDMIVTNGVTESIQMICAATIDAGDEVLVPGPSYPSYLEFTKFFGGEAGHLPHHRGGGLAAGHRRPEEEDHPADQVHRRSSTRTTRPGRSIGNKVLKEIADLAGEYNLFVISDEIYDLMTFDGECTIPRPPWPRTCP